MLRAGWVASIVIWAGCATAAAQVVADFTTDRTIVAIPDPVQFTSTSTFPPDPNASYFWSFGDGELGSGPNPSHVYTTPGVYSVTLAVHAAGETNTITKSDLITVVSMTVDFETTNYVAVGVPVDFTNLSDSAGFPATFDWTFGDGNTATSVDAVHSYAAPGLYTVSLTMTTPVAVRVKTLTNHLRVRPVEGCTAPETGGTYVLGIPPHLGGRRGELHFSSDYFATARLEDPSSQFDPKVFMDPGNVERLDSHVGVFRVEADAPFRLQGTMLATVESDGFSALPVGALGTEYRVAALPVNATDRDASQFMVTAVEDNTTVTIVPTVDVDPYTAGVPFDVQLDALGWFRLQAIDIGADLTGTRITSTKPIAVLSGNRSGSAPTTGDSAASPDYLVEQLLPVNALGTDHIVIPSAFRAQDTIRIVATRHATDVEVSGDIERFVTLDAGEARNYVIRGPVRVESSHPVIVMQYGHSNEAEPEGVVGDAYMTTILPASRFLSSYSLRTPLDAQFRPFDNYVNLVAHKLDANNGRVFLNGEAVPAAAFAATPHPDYRYTQLPLEHGIHHVDGDRPLGVYLYGYGVEFESYGYPGGCNYCETQAQPSAKEDADALREDFDDIDTDKDGWIQRWEAYAAGLTAAQFDRLDLNGDGILSLEEILDHAIGGVGRLSPVHVDFAALLPGVGTPERPFNSLREAVAYVREAGTIKIQPGMSAERFILHQSMSKPLRIEIDGGAAARVGAAP